MWQMAEESSLFQNAIITSSMSRCWKFFRHEFEN